MKKRMSTYAGWTLAICLIMGSVMVKGQSAADLSKFLNSSQQGQDASKLIGAYTAPLIRAASYGMTGGWYHTGKVHKKFGVDLGVTVNAVFIPTSDNYFNPQSLGMVSTTFNGNTTHPGLGAPTFFGTKDQTSYSTTVANQPKIFAGPEGLDIKKSIGVSAVPIPMVQLGIGLVYGTDLKIRYLPQYSRSGTKVQMLGFGLQHDIKQHIPGIKLLPFDLSVIAGFNTFKGTTDLTAPYGASQPESSDGKATYKFSSWVAQVVISKKISVLTGYVGVGYGSVTTNVDVTGTFNLNTQLLPANITNPVALKMGNSSPKLTAGLRLKLGPIYFVGDYTVQKYNSLTVGLGVSIR